MLDATFGGSSAERSNQSCNPNVVNRVAGGHVWHFARRKIRRGEELTIDCKISPNAPIYPCRCGAELPRDHQSQSPQKGVPR